jgi:hypothetical protein
MFNRLKSQSVRLGLSAGQCHMKQNTARRKRLNNTARLTRLERLKAKHCAAKATSCNKLAKTWRPGSDLQLTADNWNEKRKKTTDTLDERETRL